jgi:hypothetical protein
MPLLTDAQLGLTPKAPPRLLSDDELFSNEVVLRIAPPPQQSAPVPIASPSGGVAKRQSRLLSDDELFGASPPTAPLYLGEGGRALTPDETQTLNNRPKPPELGFAQKIASTIQRVNEDPIGAFADSTATILGKAGLMSETNANKFGRDVRAGIHSLGPLGAEFVGVASPRGAPVVARAGPPPAQAATGATPKVERAGNINLNRIYAPEDVTQVLKDTAAKNADFMAARRGVITHDETREMVLSLARPQRNLHSARRVKPSTPKKCLPRETCSCSRLRESATWPRKPRAAPMSTSSHSRKNSPAS